VISIYSVALCIGTPSNLTFNFGSCTAIQGGNFIISSGNTPLWGVSTVYSNGATNCNGNAVTVGGSLSPLGCLASTCACASGSCSTTTCQTSPPSIPGGFVVVSTYNDSACQNLIAVGGGVSSCVFTNNATFSSQGSCSGNNITTNTYTGSTCSGTPIVTTSIQGGCTKNGVVYVQIGCGAACFHESTEIRYKDEKLTLNDLKDSNHPSCNVPHIYNSDGVKIFTSCNNSTLRVSNEHLVYTQRGLIEAVTIKVGDLLFQDLQETRECKVTKIEEERIQTYFGLNCEESVVLADGFKASTFGQVHSIPSLWMRFVSKFFGVHLASQWGDYLVSLLQKWNFL